MKKIAIIGSDSFIASRFYESVNGFEYKLFTRSSSGKEAELVMDPNLISTEDLKDVDVVINFMAIVHQKAMKDEKLCMAVNAELPVRLCEIAKSAGVKHFIQMSSLAVYGDINEYDVDSALNPDGAYGKTKLSADIILEDMASDEFMVSIIRPPVVYGGGASPGSMKQLVSVALKGIPLPFKGVDNRRHMIHVLNLVEALKLIINKQLKGVFLPTDAYTISTEEILTVLQEVSGRKIRLFKFPSVFLKLIRKVRPQLYHKLYGDSVVRSNMPQDFKPLYGVKDGVKELYSALI